MFTCPICGDAFSPSKDFYITINERKAASINVCSIRCAQRYLED
jgi:uncharacterized C2H2 Zn-finger protein